MFIEHVNLSVSDLARSTDFYRRLFGFDLRWEGTLSDGRAATHVGTDQQYIALFQAAQAGTVDNDYTVVGINHFGYVVDDLAAMKERLASLGVTPEAEMDYEPGKRLYFFDPDGIEIELVEYDAATV